MSIIDQFQQISIERQDQISLDNQEIEEDHIEKVNFSFDDFITKNGEQNLHHVIGFDINDFNALYKFLKPQIIQIGRGRRSIGEKEKLFLFLTWASTGLSFSKLSTMLNIPKTKIYRSVIFITNRIRGKLISKFLPVSGEEARGYPQNRKFLNFPNAIGAVDSSIIKIRRPENNEEQKKFYSGKHKKHCIKFQCIVNPDGICIHYSGIYPGKKHDVKIFEQSRAHVFFEFSKRLPNGNQIKVRSQLLADSGYQGSHRFYEEIIIPHKKLPHQELQQEEKIQNARLSTDRIIVENFFGRMKSLFGITYSEFRGEFNLLNEIVPIIICLTNYHIHRHPLRKTVINNEELSNSDSFSDFNPEEEDNEMHSFNLNLE